MLWLCMYVCICVCMYVCTQVVFTPLLATKAGSDPNYFQSAVFQDIEMNRVVYGEGASRAHVRSVRAPIKYYYVFIAAAENILIDM
jgi:hypothetical protein